MSVDRLPNVERSETELWRVRSVIRKRSVMEPAEVAQHVIALEEEVIALRDSLRGAVATLEAIRAVVGEMEASDTHTPYNLSRLALIRARIARCLEALS